MLVFIHSFRSSLIVFVSIPISIISTFLVMNLAGFTLNLMTLLGLSLAIGILVDDSIVILENINRHLNMGKSPKEAAYDGRMEIGYTALVITLLDVIVFVPVIFSFGLVSELLRPFAVVMVTSTLMSLLVSFTIVPFLASRMRNSKKDDMLSRWGEKTEELVNKVLSSLLRFLDWSLHYPRLVLSSSFLILALSIMLVPLGFIGVEFAKGGDRSEFIIELEIDNNSTLQVTDRLCKLVETELRKFPEVQNVYSNVGITSSGRIESNTAHLAELFIKLVPPEKRSIKTSQFARQVKYHLMSTIPGINIRPIEINILGLRDDDAVQVTLTGADADSLNKAASLVLSELNNLSGVIEVQSNLGVANRSFSVLPNRKIMELLVVNLMQAGITLRTAIHGNDNFQFINEQKKLPLQIRINPSDRNELRDLQRLTVLNSKGKTVPFFEFSTIKEINSIEKRERTNRASSITIKSQVFGRPAGSVSNELKRKIEKMDIPSGIKFIWGGVTKRTTEGMSSMIMSFSISVFLIFFLLVLLYDSFSYPFIILLTIPLALIGALLALSISMEAFSVFTVLGLIILIGLVGKNAILLVDFAKKFRKDVSSSKEAVIEAVKVRFKPIVMTNLTMIIGLFPIALAQGAGAEWKNGMAWALIGGLSSSMIFTFIIIPVIYLLFDRLLNEKNIP
jgi:multidrug efflux pump subunit AcrB